MNLPFVLDPLRAALALGAAAVVVTALYLLRERFRPVLVSHLPLWEESVKRSTPLALAHRLRKILSLLLQMALVALAVLALTDPGYQEKKDPRNVVLLVDVSASMDADDGDPVGTRLDQARRFATSLIGSLGPEDRVLLVALASTPLVARSWGTVDDRLLETVRDLSATQERADAQAALEFVQASLAHRDNAEAWILSDGAFGLPDDRLDVLSERIRELESNGVEVHHHRCGSRSSNVAITHFAMRQDLRDPIRVTGMLELARFTSSDRGGAVDARIEVLSGGHPVLTRKVKLDETAERIWLDLLGPPSRQIRAVLAPGNPGRDHLQSDNTAVVTLPEQTELKVLAVSEGNTYLQAALLLSPTWNVEWIGPDRRPSRDDYDVVILDRDVPRPSVKTRGILAIAPTGEDAPVTSSGVLEVPVVETFDRDHPILRWTNLYNVNMSEALKLDTEKGDRILVSSDQGPLVLVRTMEDSTRVMAMAFDLTRSDLPLRAAWPLLFLNTVHYLGGESLEVASSTVSPLESQIQPHWLMGARHRGQPPSPRTPRPPLWLVLAACASALFVLEWFTYHKRITV